MNRLQQTIHSSCHISGKGLHTGANTKLIFLPAHEDHGIKFQRVDLDKRPIIPAYADYVTTTDRGTTLEKDGASISTVEHLLAALTGMKIDNILIQINGVEIPIMDGSAMPFIHCIEKAGIVPQDKEIEYLHIDKPINYKNESAGIEILAIPSDTYQITTLIDYQSDILGKQHATLSDLNNFKKDIGSARTFCFLHELQPLLQSNLIKGGDLNNAIVVVDKLIDEAERTHLANLFDKPNLKVEKTGILNNVSLRYQNEPARHKLLDVIGDLSLVGAPIKAHIIATKPGHTSNIAFAKLLRKTLLRTRRKSLPPKYDPSLHPLMDISKIKKTLPHRYPILMVDKIIDITDKEIIGIKNVTYNDPFFRGHFPKDPVMPGVLQIEAMAQVGGIFSLSKKENPETYNTYFLRINNARFKRKVIPGDVLIIKLELLRPEKRGILEMKGTAFVGDQIVTQAELTAQIAKK